MPQRMQTRATTAMKAPDLTCNPIGNVVARQWDLIHTRQPNGHLRERQMLTLTSTAHVEGLSSSDIFEFMMNPSDELYQRWWPGVHLQFHTVDAGGRSARTQVLMDEFVGRRRLRLTAVVVDAVPPKRIVWQFKAGILLPARLILDLVDNTSGVVITHTTEVGWAGPAAVLDPVWRLYFSDTFARDLDQHVREEFPRLTRVLPIEPRLAVAAGGP